MVCRLTEKAYRGGHSIFINVDAGSTTERLDVLLWTFRDTSFVPHGCLSSECDADVTVMIAAGQAPPNHRDVLINFAAEVPEFYGQFTRIAEIVPNEEGAKAAGRTRYRLYREQKIEINSHYVS